MDKVDYFIILADDLEVLEIEVNTKIGEGYEPLGGPTISWSRNSDFKFPSVTQFAQALTRKIKPKVNYPTKVIKK